MLNRIIIDNFATIEHLSFDLGDSLNIITGETGAGKSVLVEAVNTALGGRADISMIRSGADRAVIQVAGEKDGEEVIISREMMSTGKSISKLNGELVPLGQLREFCRSFVDIHGQYDNQQILNPENHISITDSFRNESISNELAKLSALYNDARVAKKDYEDLLDKESSARRQQDFYQFEYDYINNLKLVPGEDEKLREDLDMMKNSEKIFSAVNGSYELIHENDDSALSALSTSMNELAEVSSYSETLSDTASALSDLYYRLEDISETLRNLSESVNFSEDDLDSVSERLSVIEDAKRKYHKDVDEIISYGNELDDLLSVIADFDSEKKRLKQIYDDKYDLLKDQADLVSELRHINAERLEVAVKHELDDLEFANSEFKIEITRLDNIGPSGYDSLEFMISTNPGEPLRPLAKIASGGEISRIMLAFKHIIGDNDHVQTMIFDEIDTGISGRTALVVGKKLREISAHHQVICITHLPQIATYGKDNYSITKSIDEGKSHTSIEHLDYDGKVRTIAKLISGSEKSDNAIEASKELIRNAGI